MDFRVGPWLIRPGMNRVVRGSRSLHITPKAMEVLVCLAQREGGVVSKDELFREVWPGTYVSEDALIKCIGELRRAFSAGLRGPAIIETIAKRGYRIVAPVTQEQDDTMSSGVPGEGAASTESGSGETGRAPPAWKRFGAPALGGSLLFASAIVLYVQNGSLPTPAALRSGPPAIQSIAVLPLSDLSGDAEQEYFVEGMTEALITELAQVEAWRVISRTSVMRYKGTKKRLPEIARDLGAEGIVEGAVLRSGSRVRITARLIEAATDAHLWSGSFERDIGDVLELQRSIARGIATQLRIKLDPGKRGGAVRKGTAVPEAYEDFLKGSYFLNRSQYARAAFYFERATAQDPEFAIAHALLCEADAMETFRQDLPPTPRAMAAMAAARTLDDTLAETHMVLGDAKFFGEWDWEAGEAEFRRAAELDRSSVDSASHYAASLHALGRWDAAMQEYRRALALDPVSPRLNALFLSFLVDAGRHEQAIEQFRKTLELDPDNGRAYSRAGDVYRREGRENEALAAYLNADRLDGSTVEQLKSFERAARTGGLRGYWKKRLESLHDRAKRSRVSPLQYASVYLRAGEKDKAMQELESAYAQRIPRLAWIRASAAREPLRSDPRFQLLLRRMRFPD